MAPVELMRMSLEPGNTFSAEAMQRRYVWLVCCAAVAVEEVLSALALHRGYASAEALHSTRFTLYVVAGVGAGRLASATGVASALRAGGLAGVLTGLVGGTVYQATEWLLGGAAPSGFTVLVLRFIFMTVLAALTAGTLGLLGGIVGWGVRRSVDPAA
jgi:hypothetical protein